MAETQPPTQAETTPTASKPTAAEKPKNPARFLVNIQSPWTEFLINKSDDGLSEDLLLTTNPVEVSFDQAAVIQEACAASDAPVVITEKIEEK